MKGVYEDIISMAYPFPTSRKRMTMTERGAQFSPFAALTGYDAAIRETGRITEQPIELDVDAHAMLDEKLKCILRCREENPEITVTYFRTDDRKSGGSYIRLTGMVKNVDHQTGVIIMSNGTVIGFEQICEIDGDFFRDDWEETEDRTQDAGCCAGESR